MGDIIQEIASYAGVSAPSPSGSNGNEQSDSSRLFGPVNLQFQPQEPFVQGHAQDSLHMPWTSSLPSQPRSWQPSTHAMTENIDLDSDHKDWWNNTRAQTANDAQYGFASGPFTYGNAPGSYMHDVQANSQWPLLSPSGETAMDVGDIAMMWLQPPQLSE
ncbi:hypothetical protein DXG01_005064 [Tephrocybe rancida]|nr:hypothetical protein DXG01_005064 [Tephrocybe rancida]